MGEQCRVVLYGDSLLMGGLGISLSSRPGLQVTWVEGILVEDRDKLSALCPDVVIYDLDSAHMPSVMALIAEFPGLSSIGLHLSKGTVSMLVCKQCAAETVDDLANQIRQHARRRRNAD